MNQHVAHNKTNSKPDTSDSKLIKSIKKRFQLGDIIEILKFAIPCLAIFFLINDESFSSSGITLVTTMGILGVGFGTLASAFGCSIFKIYPEYMVCFTPLHIWKYKKLFFYHKINKVIIQKKRTMKTYTVDMYTIDDKKFEYYLDKKMLNDFVDTLRNYSVKVVVVKPENVYEW